jgi:hypothetical protein
MRDAFVLRLGSDTDPAQRRFVGWIEEVDTGRESHFKSLDELLAFLATCHEESRERARRHLHSRDDES